MIKLRKHSKKIAFFFANVLIVAVGAWIIKNFSSASQTSTASSQNNAGSKTTTNTNQAVQYQNNATGQRASTKTRTS